MAVRKYLRAVQTACLAARSRSSICRDDPLDVVTVHLPRKSPVACLPDRRGSNHGQPVSRVPCRSSSEMGDLTNKGTIVPVDAFRELVEIWDNFIVADVELAENRGRVGSHEGGSAEHRHCDAALGLLFMIELISELWFSVLSVSGRMRRADDPVLQRNGSELEGLEEGIFIRHVHRSN